jgi:hypothetical protein
MFHGLEWTVDKLTEYLVMIQCYAQKDRENQEILEQGCVLGVYSLTGGLERTVLTSATSENKGEIGRMLAAHLPQKRGVSLIFVADQQAAWAKPWRVEWEKLGKTGPVHLAHEVVVHYSKAARDAGGLASQYVNENGFTTNHVENLWKILREMPGRAAGIGTD